jgi:DNA-binding transcriptional LysR family regulator
MDLRQLEIIRAIADTGSFTAAGEKLHVSQSAISRQILLLEEELGESVFHRIGRRIRITPAGEALLQLSHRVFQDLQETVTAISEKQESLRGALRLVGGMTVCLYAFPTLLSEVRRVHPNLDLKVTVGSTERSIAMLRSGAGDLGLLTLPIDASDLISVPVLEEELLVATYPNHPLAMKRRIAPTDLNKQPFILFETGSITRRIVDDFFSREHIEAEIVMETENVEIIKAMVRSGLGISIVPWQAVAGDVRAKQLFVSRIAGHSLERQFGWLYPKMTRCPKSFECSKPYGRGWLPPRKRRRVCELRSARHGSSAARFEQSRTRDSHSVNGSRVAGVSEDDAEAGRLAAREDPGGDCEIPKPKSQTPNPNCLSRIWSLGFGAWDLGFGIYFFEVSCGVGRSEYDVRDHTFTPSRLATTSIRRVRRSGSGLLE